MKINDMQVNIDSSWHEILGYEFEKPYFNQLTSFLQLEEGKNKIIYPPADSIFSAFELTPFTQIRVLLLGQDPYHSKGQAHGLCFSVKKGMKPPPSLVNIFKELASDISFTMPDHGDLTNWAKQGVLMLNASLTVEEGKPMSHSNIGWSEFTDNVIRRVSEERKHIVFILWGRFAQTKISLIDESKHLILCAAHPSPFSAYQGFFGCKHFSKTNDYLMKQNQSAIDWQI